MSNFSSYENVLLLSVVALSVLGTLFVRAKLGPGRGQGFEIRVIVMKRVRSAVKAA